MESERNILVRPIRGIREIRAARRIYLETFTEDERFPFNMLLERRRKRGIELMGLFEGGRLLGISHAVFGNSSCYILYLAIKKGYRDRGLGSAFLEDYKRRLGGGTLYLSIERLDGSEVRRRRLCFYKRHGLRMTDWELQDSGGCYTMLSETGEVNYADLYAELKALFKGNPFRLVRVSSLTRGETES